MKNFPIIEPYLGLYPIVDTIEWIERLLNLGIQTIQLRIKNQYNNAILEKTIIDAIKLSKSYKVRLFINDYWKLAIKHKAYGVHLGQEDLNIADLDLIYKSKMRLGISTHNSNELDHAIMLRPSYIALGHIFPTKTKKMSSKPQGLTNLKHHLSRLKNTNISTVAIGGIDLEKAPKVLNTGVGGIAVVSAITKTSNWHDTTQILIKLTNSYIIRNKVGY